MEIDEAVARPVRPAHDAVPFGELHRVGAVRVDDEQVRLPRAPIAAADGTEDEEPPVRRPGRVLVVVVAVGHLHRAVTPYGRDGHMGVPGHDTGEGDPLAVRAPRGIDACAQQGNAAQHDRRPGPSELPERVVRVHLDGERGEVGGRGLVLGRDGLREL